MDPLSTGLAGMALVQKSVEFIKSNISTAQDIGQIAGAIDGLFAGQKQINQKRFSEGNTIGQYKSAANDVIDAKLAQEQLDEMAILVNNRFGYGTWQTIIRERAKRIADEKEAARRARQEKLRKQKELFQTIQLIAGIVFGVAILTIIVLVTLKYNEIL
tara:strand:+ start:3037 stop:3513 length:477 start_codon:yes stop_codon:yes gene_type:complete